jgi:ribosome recycling factor
MLDYIFQFVDKVKFHVGKDNIRSKSHGKIRANRVDEVNVAYYGEPEKLNVVFEITKEDYQI